MGLFKALEDLAVGGLKQVGHAVKTGVKIIDLDFEGAADEVGKAVDDLGDTLEDTVDDLLP